MSGRKKRGTRTFLSFCPTRLSAAIYQLDVQFSLHGRIAEVKNTLGFICELHDAFDIRAVVIVVIPGPCLAVNVAKHEVYSPLDLERSKFSCGSLHRFQTGYGVLRRIAPVSYTLHTLPRLSHEKRKLEILLWILNGTRNRHHVF